MSAQRICYYRVGKAKTGERRVRFGVSRRREAQVDTSLATWQRISVLIIGDGYRLVEIKANGTACVG